MHIVVRVEDYLNDLFLAQPQIDLEIVSLAADQLRADHFGLVDILMIVVILQKCQCLFDRRAGNTDDTNPVMDEAVRYLEWPLAGTEFHDDSTLP